jgi:hypothetical protein
MRRVSLLFHCFLSAFSLLCFASQFRLSLISFSFISRFSRPNLMFSYVLKTDLFFSFSVFQFLKRLFLLAFFSLESKVLTGSQNLRFSQVS